METDSYKTIVSPSTGLYKEKGSKFIAISKHIESEDDFKEFMAEVKKEYYDARHHCYAWRLGPDDELFRSNDDGEPSGSAGKPILNQILSKELFYTAIIVVRYFGGTKLGVSGLIRAYKTSSQEVIENSKIKKKYIYNTIELKFKYPRLNDMMRIIKEENLKISKQDFQIECLLRIDVKRNDVKYVITKFSVFHDISLIVL
ncbi:MAG: YigZ family protein [Marinilabiliales bacterium]|nr:MAG: YigZ family protein [Marinilabiliales bacterium]